MKISTILIFGLLVVVAVLWFGPPLLNPQTPPPPVPSPINTVITLTPAVAEEKNITVAQPLINSQITSPVTITGQARVFENVINYRIKDTNGTVLAQGHTTADATDVGQFGPYGVTVAYQKPTTEYGNIEVYSLSAKDGSEIDKVMVLVKFAQ